MLCQWTSSLCLQTAPLITQHHSGTTDKEPTCQCRRGKRHEFDPWLGKIPWRKWQPAPVFWPWKSYRQRNLMGYSPSGHKSWTQLRLNHHHRDGALLPGCTLLFLVYSRDSVKKDLQVLPGNETWVYHSEGIPKTGSLRALITWLQGGERLSYLSVTRERREQSSSEYASCKCWLLPLSAYF